MEEVGASIFVIYFALASTFGEAGKVMDAEIAAGDWLYTEAATNLVNFASICGFLATLATVICAVLYSPYAWWWFVIVGALIGGALSKLVVPDVSPLARPLPLCLLQAARILFAASLWLFW